jgi:hypothetical protein
MCSEACRRLRQKDPNFKAGLSYKPRTLKQTTKQSCKKTQTRSLGNEMGTNSTRGNCKDMHVPNVKSTLLYKAKVNRSKRRHSKKAVIGNFNTPYHSGQNIQDAPLKK